MRRAVRPRLDPLSPLCAEQFSTPSTPMIMSEKPARDEPRRVNMQARVASPVRTGSLLEPARPIPHRALPVLPSSCSTAL